MSDIMEIIDERERERNKDRKKQRSGASYNENVRAKWFCCAFKLGFLQLICKASLNFKSNLELALSFISKEKELYESKYVVIECRCLKTCNLLSFFIRFSNSSLKITTSFANITITTAGTSEFIY